MFITIEVDVQLKHKFVEGFIDEILNNGLSSSVS